MLQLIPALLLLLLQGPSNVERLARSGRLPEALDSIHRQIACGGKGTQIGGSRAQGAVLASLLSSRSQSDLSEALVSFLQAPSRKAVNAGASETSLLPARPRSTGRPSQAFVLSSRTRDGPSGLV